MSTPGSLVLKQLLAAVDDVRGRADAARREGETATRSLQGFTSQRAEACLELARHYLPDVRRETVQGTYSAIRGELEAILARKERSERETLDRLAKLADEHKSLDATLEETTARLNRLVEERGRLQQVVAEKLKQDGEFQRRSQAALEAETLLKRNEERADEVRREAEAKKPAYENSRLFQYLARRRFGTTEYRRGGLTRRLDRWVANLIGYERARRSYAFLQSTPKLVGDEVDRRRKEFDARMAEIEAIEKGVSDAVGLTDVLARGKAEGDARDRLVARIGQVEAQSRQDRKTLEGLQQEKGSHYQEALARMQKFLVETEGPMLAARARETRESRDDEIVQRVLDVDRRIETTRTQARSAEQKVQSLRRPLDGLELLARRFRQAEFDSDRSSFGSGFDMSAAIDSVVNGSAEPESVWARMRRAQEFAPAWGTQVGTGMGDVLSSPATAAILNAMVQVAGTVLEASAHRSVERRRGRSWHWDNADSGPAPSGPSPSWSTPSAPSAAPPSLPSAPSSAPSSGGFTSGEGF